MSPQNTPPWLSEGRLITNRQKEEFLQRYRTEIGLEGRGRIVQTSEKLSDQIHTLLTGGKNWHLWMPADSVTRLSEAENLYGEFKNIVSETANALPTEVELEPVDYYILSDNIITRLNGSKDFDHKKVRSDDFEQDPKHGDSTYDDMPIVVTSINSRNLEDWYVYVISDAPRLFGDEINSMTQAARLIFKTGLEPVHVIRDIGFHFEDYIVGRDSSVPGITAPTDPVTIIENTHYWQIDSPKQTFGNSWGSVDQMLSILEDDYQPTRFCDNPIGYWVATGASG